MGEPTKPVAQVLEAVGAGDAKAAEELLPLVYWELRKLAAHKPAPAHVTYLCFPVQICQFLRPFGFNFSY
jgi:hypothetical protein